MDVSNIDERQWFFDKVGTRHHSCRVVDVAALLRSLIDREAERAAAYEEECR